MRAARCDAFGGVRRLLGPGAAGPDRGRGGQAGHHHRRAVPPRQGGVAEGGGGRSGSSGHGRRKKPSPARAGGAPDRHRRAVDRGPRPVVARHRRERLTRAHPRSLRLRAATVFALHLGHHRCAEGHHAHHRWLPHPGVLHAPQHLRRQAGNRRVLVHRRHRLGHRAHLHRLRAAVQRGDPGALRGHPRLAQRAPPFRGDRKVRRHNLLHRANTDPHVHEVGPRAPRRPRPVQPAAAGHRGGADQPRGVALVPGRARRQPNSRSSTPGGRPRPGRR